MSHPIRFRILSLSTFLVLAACTPEPPEPEAILAASLQKCRSVQNGYYEMAYHVKYMTGADTATTEYQCYFEKSPDDTIYSSAFRHRVFENGQYLRDVLYNGTEFVRYSTEDSTGIRMSKDRWAEELESYTHNHSSHSPFTDRAGFPLQHDSIYLTRELDYRFVGEETVNGVPSYHIRMTVDPLQPDSSDMLRTFRTERNYWVSKTDSVPIQYSIEYGLVLDEDTMYQFEMNSLTSYRLDELKREEVFELSSIPAHVRLEEFKPNPAPRLLEVGTTAPDWTLQAADGKATELADYRGRLLLLDFFYQSCNSCSEAVPRLQRLHERYSDQGLRVVGIDPVDDFALDPVGAYKSINKITYPVLPADSGIAQDYRVIGYPTFYLIDRNGRVLYAHLGFDEATGAQLERIIQDNL